MKTLRTLRSLALPALLAVSGVCLPAMAQEPVPRTERARNARATQAAAAESADALRSSAREVIRAENAHVRRQARIDRLTEIYRRRGQNDRVQSLERLRAREAAAYDNQMATLKARLGEGRYARLRSSMRAQNVGQSPPRQARSTETAQRTRPVERSERARNARTQQPRPRPPAPRPPQRP